MKHSECPAKPASLRQWLTCRMCWEVKLGVAFLLASALPIAWSPLPVQGVRVALSRMLYWSGVSCLVWGLVRHVWMLIRSFKDPDQQREIVDHWTTSVASIAKHLDQRPAPFHMLFGLLGVACVGGLDFLTGQQLSFTIFYLIPVSLATWFGGAGVGALISEASILVWLSADVVETGSSLPFYVPLWNACVRLGMFLVVAFSLAALKRALVHARHDYLTGIPNAQAFFDVAARELVRARRYGYPFTIAYLDVDHFKAVNDRLGHQAGDALLRAAAETLARCIRASDMAARLGGDEFALILPETGEAAAQHVLNRVHGTLTAAMRQRQPPVTFSIGAITFVKPPENMERAMNEADKLMYVAKQKGRDQVQFVTSAS